MAKNTLRIAEYQSFGVDEIYKVLCHISSPCHTERSEVSQNNGLPRSLATSRNDKKAEKIFDELAEFAKYEDNYQLLRLVRQNGRDSLKAQNYVGLIQTQSGFCVEILPKIFRTKRENEGFGIYSCVCKNGLPLATSRNDMDICHTEGDKPEVSHTNEAQNSHKITHKCPICQAKELLIAMLKSLKNSPFKHSHFSSLKTQNMPLLDIFVLMFVNECESLVKKGIRANYVLQEQNRTFLKGKLLFNENLKYNLTHKERFFTASDEFSQNIAQNRLIKSTLELLSKMPLQNTTQSRLNQIRFIFADIAESQNIDKDLAKCVNSRHFKAYELLLLWCKLFLKRQHFTSYQGSDKAFALLFDMNVLFESYVAKQMKKWLNSAEFREKNKEKYEEFMAEIFKNVDFTNMNFLPLIKTQEKCKYLAQIQSDKSDKFLLKPDIVGYKNLQKTQNEVPLFVADTKWKILNEQESKNFGISQNDMYQMWAYLSKYQCEKGFLIYPKPLNFQVENIITTYTFKPEIFDENRGQDKKDKEQDNKDENKEQGSKFQLSIVFFPL